MAEKDKVLTDAYNAHVEMGPLRCPHVFDEYRALRMALEEEYVFALDRMTEAEAAREHGTYSRVGQGWVGGGWGKEEGDIDMTDCESIILSSAFTLLCLHNIL